MIRKYSRIHLLLSRTYSNAAPITNWVENLTEADMFHQLEDSVIPLYRTPYRRQLEMKYIASSKVLKKIHSRLMGKISKINLYSVSPSPLIEQYRNKDEFNFRTGLDGDPKTLGFFVGKAGSDNSVFCVRPTNIAIIKQHHKDIAKVFEEFVKSSELPACHDLNDGGYWRGLTVRSNQNNDTMAVVVVNDINRPQREMEQEQSRLIQHFERNDCKIKSLYYQCGASVRATEENSKLIHVTGEKYIFENMFGYKFRISPESFFQINTPAAQILYQEAFRLSKIDQTTTILDLCCGNGGLSISFSNYIRGSVGIESSISAVKDAVFNAKINNIENCDFMPGRVELVSLLPEHYKYRFHVTVNKLLRSVLRDLDAASSLTVFLNPGRSGVHPNVIKMLRNSPQIRKLIYIACKPDNPATLLNFVDLSKTTTEEDCQPFTPTEAKPVDMFPHTPHSDLILLFER